MAVIPKRRALITGASSGIGRSTALAFAKAGIDVALVSRSLDQLEGVAAEIRHHGGHASVYSIDLAAVAAVQAQITALLNEFGPVDILINNAGMGYTGSLTDTSLEDWQRVFDLNVASILQCIQAILPGMRDRQQGVIVNVASIAAHQAFPGWGAYCASKAALLALSKVLAAEERTNGIRVVTVSPGAVNTPIWDTATVQADFDRSAMLTPDIVADSILHAVQLPSSAVIEELVIMPSTGAL